jgi:hypothetical protein
MTQEEFNRDLNHYVMINNDIHRLQYGDPTLINQTPVQKNVFTQKFGFSTDDWQSLPEFEGYTVEPLHEDYRRKVDGKWNLYNPLVIHPKEGEFPTIKKLINHLYGKNAVEEDQVEELYDYHTVLLKNPKQVQQARVLYSKVQGSSKSALAKLEELMFRTNYSKIRGHEFFGDFNMIWIRSLVIHMDEPYFGKNSLDVSRRIRDMVTATTMNLRKMKQDHVPVPFFGKLLFTTNDSNFMPFERTDRRYWIRETVKHIGGDDPQFFEKLEAEVPHYLYFLLHREMKYPQRADVTFWLPESVITNTNGFKKLVSDTQEGVVDIATDLLTSYFISNPEATKVHFKLRDLYNQILEAGLSNKEMKTEKETAIMLRDIMQIGQPQNNSRLKKDAPVLGLRGNGVAKWWTAKREDFNTKVDFFDGNVIKVR